MIQTKNVTSYCKPSIPNIPIITVPVYLQRFSDNMIDFKLIYKGKPSKLVNISKY